jgi:hypothetical protein
MLENTKNWLKREWAAVKKSGTMLIAWLQAAVGIIVAAIIDLASDTNISSAIQSALQPKYVPYYIIGIGILLRFVRKRNSPDL